MLNGKHLAWYDSEKDYGAQACATALGVAPAAHNSITTARRPSRASEGERHAAATPAQAACKGEIECLGVMQKGRMTSFQGDSGRTLTVRADIGDVHLIATLSARIH